MHVVYSLSLSLQFYQDELGQERLRIEQEMQVWKACIFNQWRNFEWSLLHCKTTQSHAIMKLSTKCQNCITHVVVQRPLAIKMWLQSYSIFRHLDQQVERGNTVCRMCSCWSELIAVAFEANYDAGMNTETLLLVVAGLL